MFDHLDDPHAPDGREHHAAVTAAAQSRRRARRLLASGGAAAGAVAAVLAVVLIAPGHDHPARLLTEPASTAPSLDDPAATSGAPVVTATTTPSTRAQTQPTPRATSRSVVAPIRGGEPSAQPSASTGPAAPPPCPAVSRADAPPADSAAAFEQKIEGAWRLCEQPSVFGTDEDGLEIRADHTWSKLRRADDASYHRMTGAQNHGTWEVIDTASMNGADSPQRWQLNLVRADDRTVITQPQFWGEAPQMHLNNNGVYVADYVPLPTGAVAG
jgi:hypothetical protein